MPENSSFLHFRCALGLRKKRIGFSMCNEGEKRQAAQNPADAGAFSRAGARSQTPERIKGEGKRGQRRRFCDTQAGEPSFIAGEEESWIRDIAR